MASAGTKTSGALAALILVVGAGGVWWFLGDAFLPGGAAHARKPARAADARAVIAQVDEVEPKDGPGLGTPLAPRFGSWSPEDALPDVFAPRRLSAPGVVAEAAAESPDTLAVDVQAIDEPAVEESVDAPESVVLSPRAIEPVAWPVHDVSVVLVGYGAPRAVVDSSVVQIGDRLGAGEVVHIHDRGVVVRIATDVLEYAVGTPHSQPRVLGEVADS
jgi:hypothetical protein